MKGLVLWGVNNIFSVKGEEDGKVRECRIKGKRLDFADGNFYNPLSPGDRVEFEDQGEGRGLLLSREPRKNYFARWNRKGKALQTLAANMKRLYCIVSPQSPPFRPRFLDRALILADQGALPVSIILNKSDQAQEGWVEERLTYFQKSLGIPLWRISCKTGEGIEALRQEVKGGIVSFAGQSGVGKSTLLNILIPGADQKTRSVSQKMDRGRHTTNLAIMIPQPQRGYIIDTPGIRELLLWGLNSRELAGRLPDFAPLLGKCGFKGCRHRVEPDCQIRQSVKEGKIHPDRYESYLRMMDELIEMERTY